MATRIITFEEACEKYIHRYTMDHVPLWATRQFDGGKYYAPQFRSDREWYDNTEFPGEGSTAAREIHCYSRGLTWPLGTWLDVPYKGRR